MLTTLYPVLLILLGVPLLKQSLLSGEVNSFQNSLFGIIHPYFVDINTVERQTPLLFTNLTSITPSQNPVENSPTNIPSDLHQLYIPTY